MSDESTGAVKALVWAGDAALERALDAMQLAMENRGFTPPNWRTEMRAEDVEKLKGVTRAGILSALPDGARVVTGEQWAAAIAALDDAACALDGHGDDQAAETVRAAMRRIAEGK